MSIGPLPLTSAVGAFLLAFPALFSIVNPIGMALIFDEVTKDRSTEERAGLAWRIGVYSLLILLGSLWLGSYILAFFGVTIGALRVAGGLVVASRAWSLLMQPEAHEDRKADAAGSAARSNPHDVAFFPLTMPFTTGPGSISVAIALSSQRPDGADAFPFYAGVSAAAALIAVLVWLSYRGADKVQLLLGRSGARVVSRLVAFMLLCVGMQILSTGIGSLLGPHFR